MGMSQTKLASLIPQAPPQTGEVLHISSFGIVRLGGKILLLKMFRPETYAGKWVLPARIINFGEDPSDAMARIASTMLGTAPRTSRLIDLQSYGDRHWDLCCVYEVGVDGSVKPSDAVEKFEYFDPASLPPELLDGHREVVQGLREKGLV